MNALPISRILVCSILVLAACPAHAAMRVWTATSLQKVKQVDAPGSATSVAIKAARNEYESFQVVVTADGRSLRDCDASITDFDDGAGHVIASDQVTIYREGFLKIGRISDERGAPGLWPDALFPKVDPYFRETRKSFPFRVARGRNQPLWFDVYVPRSAASGTYHAIVTVSSNAGTAQVPVTLTVWNFTLPSKQTLESVMTFDEYGAMHQHDRRSHFDYEYARILPELTGPYLAAFVRNRIGMHYGSQDLTQSAFVYRAHPPAFDWTLFDATVGAALDGTLPGTNGNQLRNITVPDVDRPNPVYSDDEKQAIWRAFTSHFASRGWSDRLVDYAVFVSDEPRPSGFPAAQAHAALVHGADPTLRVIATTPIRIPNDATPLDKNDQIDSPLIGSVDVWVPIVNSFSVKNPATCSAPDREVPRSAYDARVAAGDQVWMYQSCESHGCTSIGDDCVRNYPSYMVDVAATHNRISEWMSWQQRVSGELYYETTYSYSQRRNPFVWLNYFTGNGDGTLFYPGVPKRIGGTHHIPIESVRLKQIRDGMEDFEFMSLLRGVGQQPFADAQVNGLVTNTYTFNEDPTALLAARAAMGDLLSDLAP